MTRQSPVDPREIVGRLPTTRDEDWKYTDLSRARDITSRWLDAGAKTVAADIDEEIERITGSIDATWFVIANGELRLPGETSGISAERLDDVPAAANALAELNSALLVDGLRVRIDGAPDKPVGLLFIDGAADAATSQARVEIEFAAGASGDVVEYHTSRGAQDHYANTIVAITVGDNANAAHLRIQSRDLRHVQTTHTTVNTGRDARFTSAGFDLGGGGIFNGEGSTLNLTDSTVSDNATLNQPAGGIYGFFGSTINITRSTVSGNVGADVAGGLRSLGAVTVLNSTFSGNTSTAWHGGGIFHTDGLLTVTNSTFVDNIAPAGTASGILVATFGAPAELVLTNSIMQGTGGAFACAIEGGAAAVITSGGGNVIADASCNPGGDDQSEIDALLGPLADNGGPTLTHVPAAASPAVDAVTGACAATDQRGIVRPQGPACDSGAVELQ